MTVPADHDFEGTVEKQTIRRVWDRAVLEHQAVNRSGKLSYFGLPGPKILDVLEWSPILGPVTGVERLRPSGAEREQDLERHRRLMRNVLTNGVHQFQLLRGEIEDVIWSTMDLDGNVPTRNDGRRPHEMRFSYSLVNLDFYGGIGYQTQSNRVRRIRALRRLFERQQGTSFALLLTINVRDTLGSDITASLRQTALRASVEMRSTLHWYAACGSAMKHYKLKALVPMFVAGIAEANGFKCFAYPVLAYTGNSQARMVHFAFYLQYTGASFQAFSDQTLDGIIRLPLLSVVGSTFRVLVNQHPGFDFDVCGDALGFLPSSTRDDTLSALVTRAGRGEVIE